MANSNFVEPRIWFAGLPGVVITAGALITDPTGRALLVKPNYRDHWTLPGGICEFGEAPHQGCAREVAEEIGLDRAPGPLLAVDWSQQYGPEQRAVMHFIFDGGTLPDGAGIVLQAEELEGHQFTADADLDTYLPARISARVRGAQRGRSERTTVYLPAPA
jgi:8-oxo-dGTP diphosphatase